MVIGSKDFGDRFEMCHVVMASNDRGGHFEMCDVLVCVISPYSYKVLMLCIGRSQLISSVQGKP